MDDLINEFTAEAREMLAALDAEVVAWEAAPDDRGRLDAIFRFVHTIKGNSGFFDLPRLTALSHAAEEALAEVRAGRRSADRGLVSAVLLTLDRIADYVDALEEKRELDADDQGLIAALSGKGEAVEAAAPRAQGSARSVRLSVDLLDRMMNGISDLVLARNALARDMRGRGEAGEPLDRLSAAVAELREAVTRTRMQRLDALFAPLPRMVRDLASEAGREAALELNGGDVELDRELIELVRDPLVHMLRNALAHGIETPAAREAAGKRRAGLLRIAACQAGNSIVIELADDGAGVDLDALAARAVSLGLITAAEAAALSPERRLELLFLPGLSTAETVSELSGRGVGMDVVRANLERIGGTVSVESELGQGTRFTLRVPLTLTIIPGLMVEAGGQLFALPRAAVDEIVRVDGPGVRLHRLAGAIVLELRGRRLPLVGLARALNLPKSEPAGFAILLRAAGGAIYALAVDRVDDSEELVVKPAAPQVLETGLYGGTSLTEDGHPVLMIDPIGFAARCGIGGPGEAEVTPAEAEAVGEPLRPALLFTGLCGAHRALPLSAVVRIEEVDASAVAFSGGRLHVALGERLLPLFGCEAASAAARFKVIRLSDGDNEVAYAAAEVLDTVEIPTETTPVAAGDAAAVALIDGRHVEIVDLHRVFAANAGSSTATERPLCLLPEGDQWIDTFLRPLVESAGYATSHAAAVGAEPQLVFLTEDNVPPLLHPQARLVRLRKAPDPAAAGDDSIYRYDRAALLRALGNGG